MAEANEVTPGDALAMIGAKSPESLKLVGDLMARNTRDAAWGLERAYEGEKHAHEQTQEKLAAAREQLAVMRYRMDWLMGLHDDPFGHPWDRGA